MPVCGGWPGPEGSVLCQQALFLLLFFSISHRTSRVRCDRCRRFGGPRPFIHPSISLTHSCFILPRTVKPLLLCRQPLTRRAPAGSVVSFFFLLLFFSSQARSTVAGGARDDARPDQEDVQQREEAHEDQGSERYDRYMRWCCCHGTKAMFSLPYFGI